MYNIFLFLLNTASSYLKFISRNIWNKLLFLYVKNKSILYRQLFLQNKQRRALCSVLKSLYAFEEKKRKGERRSLEASNKKKKRIS